MNFLDDIMQSEYKITKKLYIKGVDILMLFMITILAIAARAALFSYVSRDYTVFLKPWFDELSAQTELKGFGHSIGDYTPPYIYIMTLLTKIPIDSLVSIKIVSCVFDFIGASVLMILANKVSAKKAYGLVAYTAFLFAPTVIFNSALWAQCDIIFTLFLLLCIYYFVKKKPILAMAFFGIAFCFKLQAIFLAPLLFILWLRGKCKLRHFFIIPAVYLISIIPAFIAGRPLDELVKIYFSQAGQYKSLSLNAPNLYTWVNGESAEMIAPFGIVVCVVAVLLVAYFYIREEIEINTQQIIGLAFLFSLLIPFLLPHMHERYFYVADVLAILYAVQFKKRAFVPVIVILSSLASYAPYLFKVTPVDLKLVALAILFVLCVVVKDLFKLGSTPITETANVC